MNGLDWQTCFDDEPTAADPADDLARGRTRRRRGRVLIAGLATTAAVAAVSGAVVVGPGISAAPVAPSTAAPSPVAPRTPTASATPDRDTAPALRWTKRTGYLDVNGRTLDRSFTPAWQATTRHSWTLARTHLDPAHRHLEAYQEDAFSGGGAGGGIQVGQKIGWRVAGEDGQGMVQLAVTRFAPGSTARLGHAEDNASLCDQASEDCYTTKVDGHQVYVSDLPGGGFAMDVIQEDGELAGIIVDPLFGNNTTVALKRMGISRSTTLALLLDPALDVVG